MCENTIDDKSEQTRKSVGEQKYKPKILCKTTQGVVKTKDKILDGGKICSPDLRMRHGSVVLIRRLINTCDVDLVQIMTIAKLRFSQHVIRATDKTVFACYVQLLKNLQHFFTCLFVQAFSHSKGFFTHHPSRNIVLDMSADINRSDEIFWFLARSRTVYHRSNIRVNVTSRPVSQKI